MKRVTTKKRRTRFIPTLLGCYALSACTTTPITNNQPQSSPEEIAGLIYVVQPGDALSIIAMQHGESYRNLARWNDIAAPYTIYPGQRLRLVPPADSATLPELSDNEASAPPPVIRPKNIVAKPAKKNQPSAQDNIPVAETAENEENLTFAEHPLWQWPALGKTLRGFSARNQGLDISGEIGDPILAAADGKVVYSGSGIINYGPLIIIKHNNTYLSAYAHNKQLLVKEGDYVTQGQRIAEMGTNQSHQALLHFEIRHNGESVDPLPYLPKR